jgi:hypothetical protein
VGLWLQRVRVVQAGDGHIHIGTATRLKEQLCAAAAAERALAGGRRLVCPWCALHHSEDLLRGSSSLVASLTTWLIWTRDSVQ